MRQRIDADDPRLATPVSALVAATHQPAPGASDPVVRRLTRRGLLTAVAAGTIASGMLSSGPVSPTAAATDYMNHETGWRYCHRCRSLHRPRFETGSRGPCAAGGRHSILSSLAYLPSIYQGDSLDQDFEVGWRICKKCLVLHRTTTGPGKCATRGRHEVPKGSRVYLLMQNSPRPSSDPLQDRWRQCTKCRALHSVWDGVSGRCPAGGSHDQTPDNYLLAHE